MATGFQVFKKKTIHAIINFIKHNWFILILFGSTIVLFIALIKDNIEEPFDTAPASIPPDATNPVISEGQIYGIIPFEASVNLYNKQEVLDQYNNLDNAPEPKKEFTMTTTSFGFNAAQAPENSESTITSHVNTTIITAMAKSPALGGSTTNYTTTSLAAATTAFNSITGNLANGSNTSGAVQGAVVSAGAAAAFIAGQEIAQTAAEDKAKEIAIARAKQMGPKVKTAVMALGTATAAAVSAAATAAKNYFRVVTPATATKVSEKAGKKLVTKVGPSVTRTILKKIGRKIGAILAGRVAIMHVIAASLGATVVGFIPAAIVETIANICTIIGITVEVTMAGALEGKPPTCPPGYKLLDADIPKDISEGLSAVPIVGDILGMIGPNICARNACPEGLDEDAGLCYPKCDQGYRGVGPVCWSDTVPTSPSGVGTLKGCPAGWLDSGLLCGSGTTVIGKFDKDSRLSCPSDREDVDGLCYGKCPYVQAYSVTNKLPRFIRKRDTTRSDITMVQMNAIKRLLTASPINIQDFGLIIPPVRATALPTNNIIDLNINNTYLYYTNPTNNWSLASVNSSIDSNKYDIWIGCGPVGSNLVLDGNHKNRLNYFLTKFNNRYQTLLAEEKAVVLTTANPYIRNPDVPASNPANFTEPAPVQQPQFIGTYKKCTGNPNQWVPGIPAIPAKPAVPAKPAISAVPARAAVPAVMGSAARTEEQNWGQYLIPAGKFPDAIGNGLIDNPANTVGFWVKLLKDGSQYQQAWVPAGKAPVAPYYSLLSTSTNPNGFVITVIGAQIYPAVQSVAAQPAQAAIPAVPAQAEIPPVPEVPAVPGYYINTQVCQDVPKANPLYDATQYQTDYAAWLARKNNDPPPPSTPEAAIPTWDQVVNHPAEYPSAHVPGMPYLCGGKRGLSYGRGAGKPKIDLQSPLSYVPPPEPSPSLSADAFAETSNFKCNSDYKSAFALESMCKFYYAAARAHAAEEATGISTTFTYIKSISRIIVSSERTCDVICKMETKSILIQTTGTLITNTLSSVAPVTSTDNTDRRFYFAKIPSLCNLAPTTAIPPKLSYKPVACTNTEGFALDARAIPSSDGSYNFTYTFTPPTV